MAGRIPGALRADEIRRASALRARRPASIATPCVNEQRPISTYLVTGASGFVGRGLCRTLRERGCRVRALLHHDADGPWDERVLCDLATGEVPPAACHDAAGVFHLAGIAHSDGTEGGLESLYQRVNVGGTQALLDAAAAAGVARFVFFSSVKAAGAPGRDCVDETWDAPPDDPYGRSKRAAEERVQRAAGLQTAILRPTLVYGAGVKGNLRRMIDAVAARRFPPLPPLANRRSLVALDDLIEAAWLVMHREIPSGRVYIAADGADYSSRDLYLAICRGLGRRPSAWHVPYAALALGARIGDLLGWLARRPAPFSSAALERLCGSACYCAGRLRSELGWQPRYRFADFIEPMVRAGRAPP